MVVYACSQCDTVLTARVSRVALPDHAGQKYSHDLLPALLEPGTYVVDPGDGHPWQPEPEPHGVRLQTYHITGPPNRIGIAPGDLRGTVFIPDRLGGCCCGWDGQYGPNLACAGCGSPVATRVDDCGFWQVVWLTPEAVHPVAVAGPAQQVIDWTELPTTPPVDPCGEWRPEWEAAAAVALTHLLAVSGGKRVSVPEGLVAEVFRRTIDHLLPPGPSERHLTLTGPGLPVTATDIALVPRHPQTGEIWPCDAEAVVPLAANVWTYLAFHDRRVAVRHDDPPPLLPRTLFLPDGRVFLGALQRMGPLRQPWLRRIHDSLKDHPYLDSFR